MDFLDLSGKFFLVTGASNKKSVATHTASVLIANGANVIFSVQNSDSFDRITKLFPDSRIYICDVEDKLSIETLKSEVEAGNIKLSGMLHSIAFANFTQGMKPFHETAQDDFLQATNISCFSLVALSNTFKDLMEIDASVVTISISSTRATSYGYLGPIKAALDASVAFLAKSFSEFSGIRFNAICAGPLKTSASAGIPNYIDNYIFAEQLTLRKKALKTQEVANCAAFLLSPRSSGINATGITLDAGMSCNYFDQSVVKTCTNNLDT